MRYMKEAHTRAKPGVQEVNITQDTVDALAQASTMEEFLRIAQQRGIDWDSLPDEWLSAIAEGDVTGLLPRRPRKKNLAE